jgi:hypothetical protein
LARRERPHVEPLPDETFVELYRRRVEAENALARELLVPLAPGERPGPLIASVIVTALAGLGNLIAYVAGAHIEGKHPAAAGILLFSLVMFGLAYGMWQRSAISVLLFMAVLAVVIILFSLFLVEASNVLALVVPPIFIVGGGYLFWKLVRVLGRIQAPPGGRLPDRA